MSSVTIRGVKGSLTATCRDTSNGYRLNVAATAKGVTRTVVLDERQANDLVAYLASMMGGKFTDQWNLERRTLFPREPDHA